MKTSITLVACLLALLFTQSARAQNEDFESATAGPITTTGQVTGWNITAGTVLNSCSIAVPGPNAPNKSAILTTTVDPNVGTTVYSVFGSVANGGPVIAGLQSAGSNFLRLNNNLAGGTYETASKTITVTAANALFQYAFMEVAQDASHSCCDNPGFQVKVVNVTTSSLITCPSYSVPAGSFFSCPTPLSLTQGTLNPGYVYNPWQVVAIDLTPYIGQVIRLSFTAHDCTAAGHAGYAYLDAQAGPVNLSVNGAPVSMAGSTINIGTCGASSVNITAPAGLGPYAWAGPGTTPAQNTLSAGNQTFTATMAGTYTLTMNTLTGCAPITKIITITTTPAASINISGNTNVCSNSGSTLTASGASTYSWNTGSTTSTIIVTPSVSTTYTVNGFDSNGCPASSTVAVNVGTVPVIAIAGSNSVCAGSSVTFTLSGAGSYSSNGVAVAGNTVNVLPASTTVFTITGSNGTCTGLQTFSLVVDTNCANVWPGDANSDGTANNLDVLELGLHMAQTGPARASVSNAWQSYFANSWVGLISNGKNVCHADCNGDGTINQNDTLAIWLNYGSTHAFKSNNTTTTPQLYVQADQQYVSPGQWGSASVYLGDNANPLNLNGVAFTLNFDNTAIQQDSIAFSYMNASFLNANNNNLNFSKRVFNNGAIYAATTHTNNSNATGYGKIATFYFKVKNVVGNDTVINLDPVNAYQSSASGQLSNLTSNTGVVTVREGAATGIKNNQADVASVMIYPNPAQHFVNIKAAQELQKVELLSVDGKIVMAENSKGSTHVLNLDGLANGIYFVKVYTKSGNASLQKIVLSTE